MEHKVVAAASMITTLRIQRSPSKCKRNCLSLTKKLPQMPLKTSRLCRWLCNNERYIFRGMLQIAGGCKMYLQNFPEWDRANWGVQPVRRSATYKSRDAILKGCLHCIKWKLFYENSWYGISGGNTRIRSLSVYVGWGFQTNAFFL